MMNNIYKGSKITELDVEIHKIDNIIKGKNIPQICSSLLKIAKEGEKYFVLKNYEFSYIYLGRYMNILTQLQNRKDYKCNKEFIKEQVGGNAIQMNLMAKLEESKKNLIEIETSSLNDDAQNLENVSLSSIENSVIRRDVIDCRSLFEMMEKDSNKFLIVDCRSHEDFEQSKIIFQFLCNVPENLCIIGQTASKIENNLPNQSKVYWKLRKDRPILVFIDWFSTTFVRNSSIWNLRNIIIEWDQEIEKVPEIILLEGGYERWLLTYPMKCTNPHAVAPRHTNNSTPTIDGIEYPNLEDIVMKDESINNISSNNIPAVDRSTKNNAIKNYEKNLSQSELLEKKEKLLNKSLQNNIKIVELERDLSDVLSNKENEEDVEKKNQEIIYAIMELDTKEKDLTLENEEIDKELKYASKTVMSKTEDVEIRLKQQQIELDRKRKEAEALRIAREKKKPFDGHRTTPSKAPRKTEIILSPSALNQNVVPHFDRGSKPTNQIIPQSFYDKQDFSPTYQKVERGLTGLKNLGNTCYMNSIIQCLSHTLSLTQFLLENDYEKQINRSNNTKGHIVKTLAAVIKMLWNGECKYISTKHLKAVIGEQDNLFGGMDQQDSHEFLVMLIDWLQSDLQTISMPNNIDDLPASEKTWLEYTKAKESFILRLFYGQIKSTVKCTQCGEESATFDTFSNLSLELPMYNIDRCHIMDCFNLYFHGERISGWNCPRCKSPRDAIKKLDISKLPPVLIIHLKRFCADMYQFRKKPIYVDFPLVDLNMLPYVSPKEKIHISSLNHVYNLYAVSNHYGTMESGHYTAFCRNAKQKKWYKFDDHNVTSIDKTDVRSSAAYILFYTYLPDSHYIN